MRIAYIASLTLVCLILYASKTVAYNNGGILLHGFASQGYFISSRNNFLGNSEDGSFEFNEVGLNFAVPITDELRFGVQLFSRDLGDYGNNQLILDWAFLTYEWQSWFKLRAGKIKLPLGLYGNKRDADMLRASIFMPQGVYPEAFRELMSVLHGFECYGSIALGSAGDLDYEVYLGTLDISVDSPFVSSIFESTVGKPFADFQAEQIEINHFEGQRITWNLPVRGLRLSETHNTGKGEFGINGTNLGLSFDHVLFLSVEYESDPVLMVAEYFTSIDMLENVPVELEGFTGEIEIEGWYASISYRVRERLQFGLSYGEYFPVSSDKSGDRYKNDNNYRDYYAWQKDWTISSRLNINDYFATKFETHIIDGVALCDFSRNTSIMKKDWILYAVKISMTF